MREMPHFARMGIIIVAVLLIFILSFTIVSACSKKKEEPQPALEIIGVTADGTSLHALSDNYGEKGTLLVFFDLETGKAVELLRLLSTVAPDYPTVDIVAVSKGKGTIPEQLAKMDELGITRFPHTLFDLDGKMAETYNIGGTPITYFIDKNGLVVDGYVASISEKSLRKSLSAIA